jgi:hypothetical protein
MTGQKDFIIIKESALDLLKVLPNSREGNGFGCGASMESGKSRSVY